MTNKQQDETIKNRILGLLQKEYARSQLINDFDFAERTVDSAIKEYTEQHGNEAAESKKGDDFDPRTCQAGYQAGHCPRIPDQAPLFR